MQRTGEAGEPRLPPAQWRTPHPSTHERLQRLVIAVIQASTARLARSTPDNRSCGEVHAGEHGSLAAAVRAGAEVGERMEIAENAARMRFGRALPRLAEKLKQLRKQGLGPALDEPE